MFQGKELTIDLIHDSRHVGFAIIMQISYTLLRGQTTQVREVITNILAAQMICFMSLNVYHLSSKIECLHKLLRFFFTEKLADNKVESQNVGGNQKI